MVERDVDGYELFRRAIERRDAEAWAAIHERYRGLLIAWARRCSAGAEAADQCEDIADQALSRAWIALTPERFASFPSLPRLLGYLRACVISTAIDCVRGRASAERALDDLQIAWTATPERVVLDDLDRRTLWSIVTDLVTDEAERIVLVESCVHGSAPRFIWARHRRIFPNVRSVYTTKRNLFLRLQRNRDLLRLREDYAA